MRRASTILLCLLVILGPLTGTAWAVQDPGELLANPVQENRAEAIGSQLRCPVCQNESIEASNAALARDIRAIIRAQVVAGKSDSAIMSYMVQRYGNFILLKPPVNKLTLLLWITPPSALSAGLIVAIIAWRRRRRTPDDSIDLTDEERSLLDATVHQ